MQIVVFAVPVKDVMIYMERIRNEENERESYRKKKESNRKEDKKQYKEEKRERKLQKEKREQ